MAYVIKKNSSLPVKLQYLPQNEFLKSGLEVEFDHYKESDIGELFAIFRNVIEEGQTYPQISCDTVEEFNSYYLSHDAFVLRNSFSKEVLGSFYVKPNYPGRSSHICNGGFMVKKTWQNQGIATLLVPKFLTVARDLGYRASVFNLVYVSNTASLKLWEKFGFKEIGRVPNAGNLKGLGYTDAIQYYYDLTTVSSKGC